jgi:phage head maturation protease
MSLLAQTSVVSRSPLARTLTRDTAPAVAFAADAATRTLRSVITTADPDRAGDVVLPRGLRNAAEYLRNPVVLWAHNRALPPIGTCTRLIIEEMRIVAETRFARGVAFAEELFALYEQGVLRGWSIGFVPRRAKLRPGVAAGERRGLLVEEWDLLEYSAVPVPENPGALTLAVNKGLVRDPLLRTWLGDPFAALVG